MAFPKSPSDRYPNMLYERRMELGINVSDMAKLCGVSRRTIFRWEQGLCIPVSAYSMRNCLKAYKIANPLDVWPTTFDEDDANED